MNLQITITSISAEIRLATKPGPLKAYADVRIETAEGVLCEQGYAVIQKDGNSPFVGFPCRQGNTPGKYFAIIEAEGDIRKEIVNAILAAYRNTGNR
jgi:DNA-binding cell septation regulator SpoVG